jgi:hypothetical protein
MLGFTLSGLTLEPLHPCSTLWARQVPWLMTSEVPSGTKTPALSFSDLIASRRKLGACVNHPDWLKLEKSPPSYKALFRRPACSPYMSGVSPLCSLSLPCPQHLALLSFAESFQVLQRCMSTRSPNQAMMLRCARPCPAKLLYRAHSGEPCTGSRHIRTRSGR